MDWLEGFVSIIVPAYNAEKYLKRCMESLLKQSYDATEIIVVDDGSQDGTGKIADCYAKKYNKVKVIHKKNGGLSSARNSGLKAAKGEYIAFVDSDDYIDHEMISGMVENLKNHNADLAVCGRVDEYPKNKKIRFVMEKNIELSAEESLRRILTWNGMDIAACDKLYKHILWNELVFPEGKNNEDIVTIPVIISRADKVVHVSEPYYHYCHRENSITTSYSRKKISDFYYAIESMSDFIEMNYERLKKELIYYKNHSYLALLLMAARINWSGYETQIAGEYLKKNWRNRYSLRRISAKEKAVYVCYRLNILNSAVRVYDKIRRYKVS